MSADCWAKYITVCGLLCFADAALQKFKDEIPANHLQAWSIDPNVSDDAAEWSTTSPGVVARWNEAKVKIAYLKAGTHPTVDFRKITAALARIKTLTHNCIEFVKHTTAPNAPFWHSHPVRIYPDNPSPKPKALTCSTYNGKYTGPEVTAANPGQTMVMFNDVRNTRNGECLSDPRDAVRLIMNTLGLANEYQRPDRNKTLRFEPNYLALAHPTLREGSAGWMLDTTADISDADPFDLKSITMVSGDRYAAPGKIIFRGKGGELIQLDPVSDAMDNIQLTLAIGRTYMGV